MRTCPGQGRRSGLPLHRHAGRALIRPGAGRQARFSYSTDGTTFVPLGNALTLDNSWQFFMGYRFGVFNYASQALGGSVTVNRFAITTP